MFAFQVKKAQWTYVTASEYRHEIGILPSTSIGNGYVWLGIDGVLNISKDYAWDGPSGPTIDTPDFMRASLVHDALYQLMDEGYLSKEFRKQADDLFFKILREDKMPWFRAAYSWLAVRLFGWAVLI